MLNVGDLLADWSAGVFISTMHRVSLPLPSAEVSKHCGDDEDPAADTRVGTAVAAAATDQPRQTKVLSPRGDRLSIAFFAAPAYNARIQPFRATESDPTPTPAPDSAPAPAPDPADGSSACSSPPTSPRNIAGIVGGGGWASYNLWRKQRVKTAMKKLKWASKKRRT